MKTTQIKKYEQKMKEQQNKSKKQTTKINK